MHGEVGNDRSPLGGTQYAPRNGQDGAPETMRRHLRRRHARGWCALGVVFIPLLLAFLWMQYAAARQGDAHLMLADEYCGCRAQVASWVSDYVWTQMIWLPANVLFVLIWAALAVKLWGRRR